MAGSISLQFYARTPNLAETKKYIYIYYRSVVIFVHCLGILWWGLANILKLDSLVLGVWSLESILNDEWSHLAFVARSIFLLLLLFVRCLRSSFMHFLPASDPEAKLDAEPDISSREEQGTLLLPFLLLKFFLFFFFFFLNCLDLLIYLWIRILASSTITLLYNKLILKPSLQTFLIWRHCVLRYCSSTY